MVIDAWEGCFRKGGKCSRVDGFHQECDRSQKAKDGDSVDLL